jgi:hypothetical protein
MLEGVAGGVIDTSKVISLSPPAEGERLGLRSNKSGLMALMLVGNSLFWFESNFYIS